MQSRERLSRRSLVFHFGKVTQGRAYIHGDRNEKLPLPYSQEGEAYADELGCMTDAVNRKIPQLCWAPREDGSAAREATKAKDKM